MFEWIQAQLIFMVLWMGVCGLGLLYLRVMTGGWGDIQKDIHMANVAREKKEKEND